MFYQKVKQMKTIITALLILVLSITNAQIMNKIEQPKDLVLQLFIATDQNNWELVEQCFSEEVLLDYSSMGNPKANLKPTEITAAWKKILPGFSHTHHQIGNIQESIEKNKAAVYAYGTATHYLEDESGNVWTVVGTYNFELNKENGQWKINKMKFNFKYQDGNTKLAQKAMKALTENEDEFDGSIRNKKVVRSFFKPLESENADELANLFTDNGRHINPYHSGIFPKGAEGKEAIKAYWSPVFQNFDGMEFPIEEIYSIENSNMVFVKFKGNIKLKNGAGYYRNDYYALFTLDTKGKIVEYIEIFNPIIAAKSFGLINNIK